MNVLSLFDGMSCGQIALYEAGIEFSRYYASEIDKHAIAQTMLNFPDTIQIGSVVDLDVSKLDFVDFVIGGSPCQSFSFAGKRNGMSTKCEIEITRLEQYLELKEQCFEFEGQSYLFWEYIRILTDIRKYNPNVLFLLENVEMGSKWERVLSNAIGVFGVHINSALVSAQNRKRIYWTNIRTKHVGLFGELHSDIPKPKDRGILLRDILESDVDGKYYLSDKMLNYFDKRAANFNNGKVNVRAETDKATTLCASMSSCDISDNFVYTPVLNYNGNLKEVNQSNCIDANYYKGMDNHAQRTVICVSMVGRKTDENGTRKDNDPNIKAVHRIEPNFNGKTNCLTSVQKDNLVAEIMGDKSNCLTPDGYLATGKRNRDENGKAILTSMCDRRIRRLTPTECARLQTIPDWYKWGCSDTQQYRMLGNGWTVEVIKHIFSFIEK